MRKPLLILFMLGAGAQLGAAGLAAGEPKSVEIGEDGNVRATSGRDIGRRTVEPATRPAAAEARSGRHSRCAYPTPDRVRYAGISSATRARISAFHRNETVLYERESDLAETEQAARYEARTERFVATVPAYERERVRSAMVVMPCVVASPLPPSRF